MINTRTTTWEIPEGIREITQNYIRETMPRGTTRVISPEGVTSIGEGAFFSCTGLTQINLPAGLTRIGNWAFGSCTGLTQINLPAGLMSIGDRAFACCISLTQINLPEALTSIGNRAFLYCTGLTQMVIPEGVTSIGHGAFQDCTGLTQMILPDQFCTDAAKVRLDILEAVPCIGYGEIQRFINDLNIEGAYSINKQALLYRLASDGTFHQDELKGLKDCSFNDVMKAIKYRYSQLGADGDIRGLMNGLFGASRIDQTVEIGQLMNHDFAEIVSLGADRYPPSTLLSYMTVKDVIKYSQCKRGGSGLLSLKQRPEKGGCLEKVKTAAKIICKFLDNSTYRSAILGMNDSAIMKSAFDKHAMGLIIAGLASAVVYARMSSPLRLLAVAALPVAFTSKVYPYASEYLTKGVEAFKDANPVRLEQADQANAMELADGIANHSAAAIANGDEEVGADELATGSPTFGGSRESGE